MKLKLKIPNLSKTMWVFWIAALIPVFIGIVFLWQDKQVAWQEWLISVGLALGMAWLFQVLAGIGMTDDIETWSGYATSARQYSEWKEYYEYAVYRTEHYTEDRTEYYTDSDGKSQSRTVTEHKTREVFDHWEPTSRWHRATWDVSTTLGNYNVGENKFDYMCKQFNDRHAVAGRRHTGEHNSRMIGGDPNDYVADNRTGWIEPVTDTRHFENRVKAAPTVFSFSKVPTNISVNPWPKTIDNFRSDRVMGQALAHIDTLKWDQMNAVLGPLKKVNLIIIGFGDSGSDMSQWQEAAWVGGKKNDLVICYGNDSTGKTTWAKVFGWTERSLVKRNLETIMLEFPIDNMIIPRITEEIKQNYEIKDWSKFDYITIEPPAWCYWIYFVVMLLTQGGLYFWFHTNGLDQTGSKPGGPHWLDRLTDRSYGPGGYTGPNYYRKNDY